MVQLPMICIFLLQQNLWECASIYQHCFDQKNTGTLFFIHFSWCNQVVIDTLEPKALKICYITQIDMFQISVCLVGKRVLDIPTTGKMPSLQGLTKRHLNKFQRCQAPTPIYEALCGTLIVTVSNK